MRFAVSLVILAACGSAAPSPTGPGPAGQGPPITQPGAGQGGVAEAEPAGQPKGGAAKESPAKAEPPEPVPADPRVAADLRSFDVVWQRVAELFHDPAYGGVDWKAVRTELRPKILQAKSREEARAIMNEALGRLGKSHFGVTGPLEEDAPDGSDASVGSDAPDGSDGHGGKQPRAGEAGVGIEVRILGGAVLVTRIEPGSPAERAKLLLGAELVTVGGVALAPRIAAIAQELGASSLLPLHQARSVRRLIEGKAGTQVALGVLAGGKVTALALERAQVGQATTLGNLGTHRVVYEARKLDGQTGYIRLSIFLDPAVIVPAIARDLASFQGTAGVIIDLRGNPGGLGAMAMGIAGHLIADENKKLGTMHTRESTLDFVVNPQVQRYAGKVAVLVDELSASTSEILAGGLQDLGRARVFGRRTPGAALPSTIEALPNGDRFQYAIADYVSAGGKVLEGNGVIPDVPVALDAKILRAGKDPDIVAATRWIKEKS